MKLRITKNGKSEEIDVDFWSYFKLHFIASVILWISYTFTWFIIVLFG